MKANTKTQYVNVPIRLDEETTALMDDISNACGVSRDDVCSVLVCLWMRRELGRPLKETKQAKETKPATKKKATR